jgi:hypothetical protein
MLTITQSNLEAMMEVLIGQTNGMELMLLNGYNFRVSRALQVGFHPNVVQQFWVFIRHTLLDFYFLDNLLKRIHLKILISARYVSYKKIYFGNF